jgi:hypothetical protein
VSPHRFRGASSGAKAWYRTPARKPHLSWAKCRPRRPWGCRPTTSVDAGTQHAHTQIRHDERRGGDNGDDVPCEACLLHSLFALARKTQCIVRNKYSSCIPFVRRSVKASWVKHCESSSSFAEVQGCKRCRGSGTLEWGGHTCACPTPCWRPTRTKSVSSERTMCSGTARVSTAQGALGAVWHGAMRTGRTQSQERWRRSPK